MGRAICSFADCSKQAIARGWCGTHYSQWRIKFGADECRPHAKPGEPQAFLAKALVHDGDECLIWPYGKVTGYGYINGEGPSGIVSRIVCEKTHGPPPTPDQEAAHLCGNGHLACVNRHHLVWKTHAGNMTDMVDHGRSQRGVKSTSAKLTEAEVLAIRALAGTASYRKLAERFAVNYRSIGRIIKRQDWKHL